MSNKRKRDEIAAAQERFNKMTIVIERGVLKPDIRVARFDFIYQKFQENQWSSMLNDGGKIYPRLVWEFYKNLVITNLHEQSPSFETKVRSVKIRIDTSLISSVTSIPISTDLGIPFPKTAAQPSRDELMACFNQRKKFVWNKEGKNNVPIGWFDSPQRFLARIVLQNFWPITRHSDVPLNRARLIYAIIKQVPF